MRQAWSGSWSVVRKTCRVYVPVERTQRAASKQTGRLITEDAKCWEETQYMEERMTWGWGLDKGCCTGHWGMARGRQPEAGKLSLGSRVRFCRGKGIAGRGQKGHMEWSTLTVVVSEDTQDPSPQACQS